MTALPSATVTATPAGKYSGADRHCERKGAKSMTLIPELPPEAKGAPRNEAQRKGTTLAQIILEDLRSRYPAPRPRQDKMTALFTP